MIESAEDGRGDVFRVRRLTTDSLAMAAYCYAIAHGGIPLPMREVLEIVLDV